MQHGTDIQTTVTPTAANNQPCFEPRPKPADNVQTDKRKEGKRAKLKITL
jgi:hypothetical protein